MATPTTDLSSDSGLLSYRPDIDGLRAIAVAVVVAFHVGVPGFGGGFVGVDVFFVISGFLITGLLVNELIASGRISLSRFYARRVRRLLPALVLVAFVTVGLGFFLLLPIDGEEQQLGYSAMATGVSASNFYFWSVLDYFRGPAELVPLLHTWSLAVEEQYYLLWPPALLILFLLAGKRNERFRPSLGIVLAIVMAISLLISAWATNHKPTAAFYLMPARAWEFALGGLLMLAAPRLARLSRPIRTGLALLGAVAIGVSVLMFDRHTPFPGTAALIPGIGTAALLAAGCGGINSAPIRLLASPPFVGLGLLSYSWYLWHWPLLALTRTGDLLHRPLLRDVAIALAALGLAWLTYRFVENPIRKRRPGPFRTTMATLIVGVALSALLVAEGAALAFRGERQQLDPRLSQINAASHDRPPLSSQCMADEDEAFTGLPPAAPCTVGSAPPVRIAMWGDSHANTLFPLLTSAASELRTGAREFARASCPPLLGVVPFDRGAADLDCQRFNEAVIRELESLAGVGLRGVVLAGRWAAYVGLPQPNPHDHPTASLSYGSTPLDTPGSLEALEVGLSRAVARLRAAGLHVVVIDEIPELYFRSPSCLARHSLEECSIARTSVDQRNTPITVSLTAAVRGMTEVRLINPIQELCDRRLCYPVRDGVLMYIDSHHLTSTGARSLLPAWREEFRWASLAPTVAAAERVQPPAPQTRRAANPAGEPGAGGDRISLAPGRAVPDAATRSGQRR